MNIRQAELEDLDAIAILFDRYRQFYEQAPDLVAAKAFIEARLTGEDSIILLAEMDGKAVGFTQLYYSFSSTAMARIFILNDLFVAEEARRAGVGEALLDAAAEAGRAHGALRLTLNTAHTNTRAQGLYEAQGWQLDEVFRTYNLPL